MPRQPDAPLQRLLRQPEVFGFFQAVRLLVLARQRPHGLEEGLARASDAAVRLGAYASMAFPAAEIQSLHLMEEAGPPQLRVNFLGLYGPSGVLPSHYTQWLMRQRQQRNEGAAAFLDIFNHRALLLFWLAWARHNPAVMQELADTSGIVHHVYDLIGMGTPGLLPGRSARQQARTPAHGQAGTPAAAAPSGCPPADALGYYSGLIGQRPHGSTAMAQIIGDYCGVPASAQPCLGTWQPVPQRSRLGSASAKLGQSALLGSRYWDRQATLRLRLGPLSQAQFEALLPHRPKLVKAVALARFMSAMAPDLRLQLRLAAREVPALRLQAPPGTAAPASPPSPPARLGWNTWLAGRRKTTPADDCEFHFPATGAPPWR
ncbi:type VI secretion system baseplate subunit TssG [Corticibacter populi]|uniref:Type VI secretion system baseplate subunit TssG n=1 Tax=Corticibacter populi TaxID=1550736 RepID=A0A3M6QP00_9BURK|nr:type VI secretion system baseplate subunit TssG [Corticibacter populi]RMX04249.1 type VI secretion system baseplate subunit TssG [Corticibacter populi]RZS33291.1 type VI secretion system protein ImpH [Corticibacter populi]